MRKISFFIMICMFALSFASCGTSSQTMASTKVQVYFVDSDMLRLIPTDVYTTENNPQKAADMVVQELLKGRDDNHKVRRLIPNIKNGMTVRVKGKIAYVDLSPELVQNCPEGRDLECLAVYQIVNSLTSIEEIVNVRFTIGGEVQRDFKGYIDMRETFIPDYYV